MDGVISCFGLAILNRSAGRVLRYRDGARKRASLSDFCDVSGIGVVRKSIYRNVYYSHQVTTSTRIQRWPKGKIVICGREFWTSVRPGVFRVRPIAGKRRCKMFDVVCDWYNSPNPDLKIGVSFERE